MQKKICFIVNILTFILHGLQFALPFYKVYSLHFHSTRSTVYTSILQGVQFTLQFYIQFTLPFYMVYSLHFHSTWSTVYTSILHGLPFTLPFYNPTFLFYYCLPYKTHFLWQNSFHLIDFQFYHQLLFCKVLNPPFSFHALSNLRFSPQNSILRFSQLRSILNSTVKS